MFLSDRVLPRVLSSRYASLSLKIHFLKFDIISWGWPGYTSENMPSILEKLMFICFNGFQANCLHSCSWKQAFKTDLLSLYGNSIIISIVTGSNYNNHSRHVQQSHNTSVVVFKNFKNYTLNNNNDQKMTRFLVTCGKWQTFLWLNLFQQIRK